MGNRCVTGCKSYGVQNVLATTDYPTLSLSPEMEMNGCHQQVSILSLKIDIYINVIISVSSKRVTSRTLCKHENLTLEASVRQPFTLNIGFG